MKGTATPGWAPWGVLLMSTLLVGVPGESYARRAPTKPTLAGVKAQVGEATECKALAPVRCRALKKIIDMGSEANDLVAQVMVESESRHRQVAIVALGHMDAKEHAEKLPGLITDRDRGVREAAITAIGRLQPPNAVDVLARAIGAENVNEKLVAAVALGRTKSPGAVDPLLAALDHYHPKVKMSVVRSLGFLGDRRATMPLAEMLADPVHVAPVRRLVCESLGRIGDPRALGMLLQVLGDPDQTVRVKAITALGQLKDDRAIPALQLLMRNDGLAEACALALGQIADPAGLPALLRALKERRLPKDVLKKTFWAVGSISSPSSTTALKGFLKDEDTDFVLWATDGLGRLRDSRSTEALLQVLRRDEVELKEMAAWALQQISGKNLGTDVERWEQWVYSPDRAR